MNKEELQSVLTKMSNKDKLSHEELELAMDFLKLVLMRLQSASAKATMLQSFIQDHGPIPEKYRQEILLILWGPDSEAVH